MQCGVLVFVSLAKSCKYGEVKRSKVLVVKCQHVPETSVAASLW